MSDKIREFVDVPKEFFKDGMQFMNRCTKPDRKEFLQICRAVGTGFVVMGFIGYLVKLIHIPINNILVYVCAVTRRRWLTHAVVVHRSRDTSPWQSHLGHTSEVLHSDYPVQGGGTAEAADAPGRRTH